MSKVTKLVEASSTFSSLNLSMRLLAAEPRSPAGALYGTILVPMCSCVTWCGTSGLKSSANASFLT